MRACTERSEVWAAMESNHAPRSYQERVLTDELAAHCHAELISASIEKDPETSSG